MKAKNLAAMFDPRHNSLNAIRLVLATLVIVSHAWPLSGSSAPEPSAGGANLGTWAVLGFFGISGFLITRSRTGRASTRDFYTARFLRIFPGFLACLFVVAFAFAPLSLLFDSSGAWDVSDAISYLAHNLALYPPSIYQEGISSTLSTVPYPGNWDGALWTLFWEATCYVLIGVLVSISPKRALPGLLISALVIGTLISVSEQFQLVSLPIPALLVRVMPMYLAFIAGAILYILGERFPVGILPVAAAVALILGFSFAGLIQPLGPLPFVYLLLYLGAALPPALQRVGSRFDISYGMYIYGWPVLQFIALIFGSSVPVPIFILIAIAGTIPLAYLSCRLIEQPAMRLKPKGRQLLPELSK